MTARVWCGAYECGEILDDTEEARVGHLRSVHPDLFGTLYLPMPTEALPASVTPVVTERACEDVPVTGAWL